MADLLDAFSDKKMFQKILFRANAEIVRSIRDYARDHGIDVSEQIAENMGLPADGVLPIVRTTVWALPYSSKEHWEGDKSRFRLSLRVACKEADMHARQVTETEVTHLVDQFLRRWYVAEKKKRTAKLTFEPKDKATPKPNKDLNGLLYTVKSEVAQSMRAYNSDYADTVAMEVARETGMPAEEVGFTLRAGAMGIPYINEKDWSLSRKVFKDELLRACHQAGLHERDVSDDDVEAIFSLFFRSWIVHEQRWSSLKLVFQKEDKGKEAEIGKRPDGWFVEFKARGLFFYPPQWLLRGDRKWKETMSVRYKDWKRRSTDDNLYVIYHIYETSTEGIRHSYYPSGLSPRIQHHYPTTGPNGQIGEAEYRGRRAGAMPGETQDRILEEILAETARRLPDVVVETSVTNGEYVARLSVPAIGMPSPTEETVLKEIEEAFKKEYPKDDFDFAWGENDHDF